MQELDDKIVLASATSSFLQNAFLASQIIMLGPPKSAPKKGAASKKEDKKRK